MYEMSVLVDSVLECGDGVRRIKRAPDKDRKLGG
jgi:hypothetical protein